jgi:hypothetical protein
MKAKNHETIYKNLFTIATVMPGNLARGQWNAHLIPAVMNSDILFDFLPAKVGVEYQ